MPSVCPRILPLSEEVIAQIRSSKHIISLQGVVSSLLENSLDAGADRIEVTIDCSRGSCSVDDNGAGIDSAEFGESGGLCKMHYTSKCSVAQDDRKTRSMYHGATGTFLAELASVSLLSITSMHTASTSSATLAMHHGKCIARHISNEQPLGLLDSRCSNGTHVVVRDLFGSMPVRVKQRSKLSDRHPDGEKVWQEVKRNVVALLLAWPYPCGLRLRHATNQSKVMNISGHHPDVSRALTAKSLQKFAGKTINYDLRDALPILFQAGLAPPETSNRWVRLAASTPAVSLKGLICMDAVPTNRCQFITIGISPIDTKEGHNHFYGCVNRLFAQSSFGMPAEEAIKLKHERGSLEDGTSSSECRSRRYSTNRAQQRKVVDRHAMYFLQLSFKDTVSCSRSPVDTASDASVKVLTDVLEAAVSMWLESNHYGLRKRENSNTAQQSYSSAKISSLRMSEILTIRDHVQATVNPSQTRKMRMVSAQKGVVELSRRSSSGADETGPDTETHRAIDLSCWSNIRSGRNSRSGPSTGKEPVTARKCENDILRFESSPCEMSYQQVHCPPASRHVPGLEGAHCGSVERQEGAHAPDFPTHSHHAALKSHHSNSLNMDQLISGDDFGSLDEDDLITAANMVEDKASSVAASDETVNWVDPVSKQVFKINSRTGAVLPSWKQAVLPHSNTCPVTRCSREVGAVNTDSMSMKMSLPLERRVSLRSRDASTLPSTARSSHIPDFLRDWNNPVFQRRKEQQIPVASPNGPQLHELHAPEHCFMHQKSDAFAGRGMKLSRRAIQSAKVIGQVDRKFILCRMDAKSRSKVNTQDDQTLILVDQHAASERVILEDLLAHLCHGCEETRRTPDSHGALAGIEASSSRQSIALVKPLCFEVSSREQELFRRYRRHFELWCVEYEVITRSAILTGSNDDEATSSKHAYQIHVKSLPKAIAERCVNLPNLCIDMMRTEIWALEDGTKKATVAHKVETLGKEEESLSENPENPRPSWLHHIVTCPQGILEMLNSRACRSAIMFNDELSIPECEALMFDLGKCIFPFVCAHGRTSMAPLAGLDDFGSADGEADGFGAGRI